MSWVDKLRGELIDIVEWLDDDPQTLVWRFPRYHNQIKNGARLIVRPGQVALFVHQGRIADVFAAGTHALETGNLPILSTLQGWMHGFDSPFKAEVYFVSTRQVTGLKWGTPNPVPLRDADFGVVRVRAFGQYTLQARDPKALLTQLVGTDQSYDAEEIAELLRAIIAHSFADLVANAGVSLLDLAANYGSLSGRLRRMVLERVDQEYGLDVPQLYIVNVSVPEEVERALDARSGMGILGDLDAFQRYQLGRSLPAAAENPAGGLAGAGIGLGMGAAVAGQMMGGGSRAVPPPVLAAASHSAVAPGPPAPPVPRWHVAAGGRSFGPFSTLQLAEEAAAGRLTQASHVWAPGFADWQPVVRVPEIAALFGSAPPPPPPAS
jgi:membrane protease subunit (stomatin/prohibitin family)